MNLFYQNVMDYVVSPLLHLLFHLLSLFNPKVKQGLELRKDSPWLKEKLKNPIWIHCSSGEFEYAKPVIRGIKEKNPGQDILLTYFSPSVKTAVENHPQVDFSCPTPWENANSWQEFIDHHQPKALLIARTDLWPQMLSQARKNAIPSLLFSATLVEKSGRMNPLLRGFYSWVLSQLDEVYCVSEGDQQCFLELGCGESKVMGETRFDQVLIRLNEPRNIKKELFSNVRKTDVFIAGSTWEEDEKIVLPAFSFVKNHSWLSKRNVKMILSPHEPTEKHLSELEKHLLSHNLSFQYYSDCNKWTQDVLIIDQVGILADLYPYASLAFVGGSYRKTVHSVMEPLAAGCLTILGSLFHNSREALEFENVEIETAKAVSPAANKEEFSRILLKYFTSKELETCNSKLQAKVKEKAGATQSVLEWLENR